MALKIKKQYRNPDGTLIEVEGTEAEIESFEKKQRKQKQQIESDEKKKTILYGKEFEEAVRKIVREETDKNNPVRTVIEYRYIYQPAQTTTWTPNPNQPVWISVGSSTTAAGSSNYTGQISTTSNSIGTFTSSPKGYVMSPSKV